MKLIGRKKEITYINETFTSKKPEVLLIYGRRRLGKTTLLKHCLPKKSLYFLCTQESSLQNLQAFKEELAKILKNPLIADSKAQTWVSFFQSVIDFIPKHFIFAFDEFPYLVSKDSSIPSQFQKIIDEYLKPHNISIVLCGSSLSIMKNLQGYTSPLYGRRTKALNLKPFTLKESLEYLKDMTKIDACKCHLALGGVPYYFEQLNTNHSFEKNIKNLFFVTTGIFIDEPQFLLQSEFKEIQNYLNILKTITKGKTTFTEISDVTFIEKGSLSKYLTILQNLELIQTQISFFAKQNSKKTRYIVTDNFLYFYFALKQEKSIQTILGYLFEKEVRTIFSKKYPDARPYFQKEVEIDLLYTDTEIHCVEIKLSKDKRDILSSLEKKIQYLPKNTYKLHTITLKDDIPYLLKLID